MQDLQLFESAARVIRDKLARGLDIEDALWALRRANGGAMIQSIGGVRKALGVSLVDARELIETSPAFNADHAVHARSRAELLTRLTAAIEAARLAGQADLG